MLKRICKKCGEEAVADRLLCLSCKREYYTAAGQKEMAESLVGHRYLGQYREETLAWWHEKQLRIAAHAARIESEIRAMEIKGTIKKRRLSRPREMRAYVKELQAAARMQNRSTIC